MEEPDCSELAEGLATSILHTVLYVDVFDYPLSQTEIHRYLIGREASLEELARSLGTDAPLPGEPDL